MRLVPWQDPARRRPMHAVPRDGREVRRIQEASAWDLRWRSRQSGVDRRGAGE